MQKILQKEHLNLLNIKNIFIVLSIFGFFIGRISIFHTINPIAIAYLSALNFSGRIFFTTLICVVLGFLSKISDIYFSKYIICSCLLLIFNFTNNNINRNYINKALIGSICMFISGIIITISNSFSSYYLMLTILETILTFSISILLEKGINLILNNNNTLNTEEIISLIILLSSVIIGSADVFWGKFYFNYFFVILLLLSITYNLGSTFGAIAGIICSLLLALTNEFNEILIVFCASSVFSGFLRNKGKIYTILTFLLSTYLISFLLNISFLNKNLFYSSLVASLTFFVLPCKFLRQFDSIEINKSQNSDYIEKLKSLTITRLINYSKSFENLSKTFFSFSEKKSNLDQQDISNLIDDVVSKVCSSCKLKSFCWENNFYKTYQTIFLLLNNCENNGFIDYNKIPEDFVNNCINVPVFIDVLNKTFELYKVNLMWKNKIIDSRDLVGQQLVGVSKIITDLSKELEENIKFKENLSKKIKFQLEKNGISVKNIITTENKNKKIEILLKVDPCYVPNGCSKTILPIVENVLNKKMCRNCYDCIITKEKNEEVCTMTLVEEQKLRISTAVASETKNSSKVSGDSHTFMPLPNGNYLLALSDGMGSGSKAKAESAASIELFEDFMVAGFNKHMAINMINSVLFLKSSHESFSTLDICTLDLYSGICEFIKIGAVSSFVIKKDKIEVLKSSSLPVGILNNVEPEIRKIRLEPNDIIVMMTDGIIDSKNTLINKENWILSVLENIKLNKKNPQDIANTILEKAKQNSKNKVKDDMTVLVARVWNSYN